MSAIPPVPTDLPLNLRQFLTALRQTLEIGEGRIKGDRYLKASDKAGGGTSGAVIIQAGAASAQSAGVAVPPAPTGVLVHSETAPILIVWDNPNRQYTGHGYTEIYRSEVGNFIGSPLYATVSGTLFFDGGALLDVRYYYFVRHVNALGVAGPVHSFGGSWGQVAAISPSAVTNFQRILNNAIGEDQLTDDINAVIAGIGENAQAINVLEEQADATTGRLDALETGRLQHGNQITDLTNASLGHSSQIDNLENENSDQETRIEALEGVGISLANIGGQVKPVYLDPVRNATLTIETLSATWVAPSAGVSAWLPACWVAPLDGVIVGLAAHCASNTGTDKALSLFVDDTEILPPDFPSLIFVNGTDVIVNNQSLNIPVGAGARVRFFADASPDTTGAITLTLLLKSRL